MSKKTFEYLESLENSDYKNLANEIAAKFLSNPDDEEIVYVISILGGEEQVPGFEKKITDDVNELAAETKRIREFALTLLNSIFELVSAGQSLSQENLEKLYFNIEHAFINYVSIWNKPRQISSKDSKHFDYVADDMLYLSRVLVALDKIKIRCNINEYNSMSPFEKVKSDSFAGAMKSLLNLKLEINDNSHIDPELVASVANNDDIINRLQLGNEKEHKGILNKAISVCSSALNNINAVECGLMEETKEKMSQAIDIFHQHYIAEYQSSSAVCDLIDEAHTL
jgi:hypothetical protein